MSKSQALSVFNFEIADLISDKAKSRQNSSQA